jgi:hypothetical protein
MTKKALMLSQAGVAILFGLMYFFDFISISAGPFNLSFSLSAITELTNQFNTEIGAEMILLIGGLILIAGIGAILGYSAIKSIPLVENNQKIFLYVLVALKALVFGGVYLTIFAKITASTFVQVNWGITMWVWLIAILSIGGSIIFENKLLKKA